MALETATHINDLVITNPDGLDDLSQGDNHIRMLKDVIKRDLPLTTPATALGISLLTSATSEAARSFLGASNNTFRNRVINGDMNILQRFNSSITVVAGAPLVYTLDRFYAYCTGGDININQNISLQKKAMGVVSTNGSNTGVIIGTRLQSDNTNDLINNNATLSCLIKLGIGTLNINWAVYYAAAADSFGTIASPTRVAISSGTFAATTTQTLFSATMAIPSAAYTGIEIVFSIAALNNGGNPLTITNVQFEKGSVAASDVVFEVVDAPLQFSRCRHYYRRFSNRAGLVVLGSGHQNTLTSSRITLPIDDMRSVPSVVFGGTVLLDVAGSSTAATLSTQYNSLNSVAFDVTHASIGAAGGAVMIQLPFASSNFVEISAEL
jgi:hypothetical protein